MKINREDVVQAALTVERWCNKHFNVTCMEDGSCPFGFVYNGNNYCQLTDQFEPGHWGLEGFLRTRGLRDESVGRL